MDCKLSLDFCSEIHIYVPWGSESCADKHNSGDVFGNLRSREQGHVGGLKDSEHLETIHFQFRLPGEFSVAHEGFCEDLA